MKKIKTNIKLFGIMAAVLLIFSGMTSHVCATVQEGGVAVTYEKDESESYPLFVQVSGPGAVKIEEDVLRDGERNYLLDVDATKTIELIPNKGASIKTVIVNGKNSISEVRHNQLIVKGMEKGQSLTVAFQNGNERMVQTGDMANIGLYLILLFLSFGGGIYFCVFKKWLDGNRRKR